MPRRWSGVLIIEGVQTGDGRVIAPDALEWEVPFPLEWCLENQGSHDGYTVVGMVETVTRAADGRIEATGTLDDGNDTGVELVRLMGLDPPLASGVSVVMDDMEIQLLIQGDDDADEILLLASGRQLFAAAGDPDPGDDNPDGPILIDEYASDMYLERITHARIRAATLVDVPAFIDARITLDAETDAEAPDPPADEPAAAALAASAPVRPPACWFRMPEPEVGDDLLVDQGRGWLAVPLTITDEGQVFGHAAVEGGQHVGYPGARVTPPSSVTGYREFHLGHVVCAGGEDVPTGVLVAGCEHAPILLSAGTARDHYANNADGWADVRVVDGVFGPWVCGALRPDVTDEQVRALRGGSLSGDWREIGGNLELIACQAVNTPGFPVYREALAASGYVRPQQRVTIHMDNGRQTALVASGVVTRCPDCAERARLAAASNGHTSDPEVLRYLKMLELRTRHLVPAAAAHATARIRS